MNGVSGQMPLRNLKVVLFKEATAVLLRDAINNYCRGLAAGTAPVNYAAAAVGEATYIGAHLDIVGTDFVAMLEFAT